MILDGFFPYHVDSSNHLERIFWMSPKQIESVKKFGRVLVTDTKAKTNQFEMYLMTFVEIDGKLFLASCIDFMLI